MATDADHGPPAAGPADDQPRERLDSIRARLRSSAILRKHDPRDVDLLLASHLNVSSAWIIAHGDHPIEPDLVEHLLKRRWLGEPVQYLRGRADFYGRSFVVDPRVLIPRPETELLVEATLRYAPHGALVADIGTGSGCIAISLKRERMDLRVIGIDRSIEALAVAALNRSRLEAAIGLVASDLGESLAGPFDIVVSNPPYIASADIADLATEVRDHEPRMALTPGLHSTGAEFYERIFKAARAPMILVEIGFGQEGDVRAIAGAGGYVVDEVIPDLAGIPRVVVSSRA